MKILNELLENVLEMEKLFKKIKNEEQKELLPIYKEILNDLEKKEYLLMKSISIEEKDKLKEQLSKKYGFEFEGIFLSKFYKYKDMPLFLLRVYHKLFQELFFYQLQTYSMLSQEESESIIGNPYVDKIRKINNNINEFEKIILINMLILKKEDENILSFLYYPNNIEEIATKNNELLTKKIDSKVNTEYILYHILYDIPFLVNDILSAKEQKKLKEKLTLLQAYLIGFDENFESDIMGVIFKTCTSYLKENKSKSMNLNALNSLLKSLNKPTFNKNIPQPTIEFKQDNPKKTNMYNIDMFIKFDNYLYELTKNSIKIWEQYKKVVDNKIKSGKKSSRIIIYESLKKYLKEEERILNEIQEFESFQEYIIYFYIKDKMLYPFYNVKAAKKLGEYSLESYEQIIELAKERLYEIILKRNIDTQNINKQEYDNLKTMDESEEIEEKIESLEQVIQTIIDYLIGKISEEVMISQLEDLGYLDSYLFEDEYIITIFDIIYENYKYFLNEYIKEHKEEKNRTTLQYALYILDFLDENINTLVENDFAIERKLSKKKKSLKAEDYQYVLAELGEALDNKIDYEEQQISYECFLKALQNVIPKNIIENTKKEQKLKRTRKENENGRI